ncbi:MAG: hypothetical protein Q9187_006606 [Circinaria calcarea]
MSNDSAPPDDSLNTDDVPIPTIEEIEKKGHRHQHPSGTPNITIYKLKYLIKKSQNHRHDRLLKEIENMEFVAKHTTIPVPKVLAVLKADDGITTYLVMNYIPAPTVEEAWPGLSPAEKEEVALELAKHLRQLHGLRPASPAMFSGCNGGPLPDDLLCLVPGHKRVQSLGYDLEKIGSSLQYQRHGNGVVHHAYNGPFYGEAEWVTALWARCFEWNRNNSLILKKMAERVFRDHAAQFCHGDLQLKNILLERTPAEKRENDSHFRLTLIDWEAAGFYPEFWDFCISVFCGSKSGWANYVDQAMKPYWAEYPLFAMSYELIGPFYKPHGG